MSCNTRPNNLTGGLTASMVSSITSASDVISFEIAFIEKKIMEFIKDDGCKGNCITIDNGTPMTHNGTIQSVNVIEGGSGYYPVVPTIDVQSPNGSGAYLELLVSDGTITNVNVISAGQDYDEPEIIIGDTNGTGAQFTVSLGSSGEISEVDVVNGGQGYHPIYPTVSLSDYGSGSGAIFLVSIDLMDGSISDVQVYDGGHGFADGTNGSILASEFSGGSGAEIELTISEPPCGYEDNKKFYDYLSGQGNNCGASNIINRVKSHFRSKGYIINSHVNPNTGDTILWEICWC